MIRHYHLILDEESGHATMLVIHGLDLGDPQGTQIQATRAESEAAAAFAGVLVDAGELERVNIREGEAPFVNRYSARGAREPQ